MWEAAQQKNLSLTLSAMKLSVGGGDHNAWIMHHQGAAEVGWIQPQCSKVKASELWPTKQAVMMGKAAKTEYSWG